jgi:catechol 2,3-dioxygenase-like lactoylglutathione lyase family enzyme
MNIVEQDFDIEDLLSRPLCANLATFGDAGPCETPVWFLWEEGAIWIIARSKSSFAKRLLKDERAAVGIVDFDLKRGFLQHLGMRGAARVLPMDAERRSRLVARYLGSEDAWNSWFKGNVVEHQDVLIKFVPNTVVARDQSYFHHGDSSNKVEKNSPVSEQLTLMLDHVSFGVSDIARSSLFYDAALGGIGYSRIWTTPNAAGYGRSGTDEPFAIRQAPAQVPVPDQRCHIAFFAPDRAAVHDFYNAAIAHGAQDDGPPGLCTEYSDQYYAAFVRDPDGYRIEAVCHD